MCYANIDSWYYDGLSVQFFLYVKLMLYFMVIKGIDSNNIIMSVIFVV